MNLESMAPEILHLIALSGDLSGGEILCLALTCKTIYEAILAGNNLKYARVASGLTLEDCCAHGFTETFKLIVSRDPPLYPLFKVQNLMANAIENGHADITWTLISLSDSYKRTWHHLFWAHRSIFSDACADGHTEVVRLLLTWSPWCKIPMFQIQEGLSKAVEEGNLDIANMLLDDWRVTPFPIMGFNNISAFWYACRNGYLDLVKRFINDPRCDSDERQKGLEVAACNGHVEIVQLFLGLPDFDPSQDSNAAIKAAYRGSTIVNNYRFGQCISGTIYLLLADKRVASTWDDQEAPFDRF